LIAAEYQTQLQSGMLGFAVLAHLAQTRRVKRISKKVDPGQARRIKILDLKPRDATFIKVALNSDESVFVSHDLEDFPDTVRATIRTDLGIDVIEATEGQARL